MVENYLIIVCKTIELGALMLKEMLVVFSYPQGWRGTNGRGGPFVRKHPEPLNPLTPVSGSVLLQCQYERHSCVSPLPHQNGVLWWYDDKSGTQRKWNSEDEWRVYWSALHRLISFSCVSQINGDRLIRLSASASGASPFFQILDKTRLIVRRQSPVTFFSCSSVFFSALYLHRLTFLDVLVILHYRLVTPGDTDAIQRNGTGTWRTIFSCCVVAYRWERGQQVFRLPSERQWKTCVFVPFAFSSLWIFCSLKELCLEMYLESKASSPRLLKPFSLPARHPTHAGFSARRQKDVYLTLPRTSERFSLELHPSHHTVSMIISYHWSAEGSTEP